MEATKRKSPKKSEAEVQAEVKLLSGLIPGLRIFRNNIAKIKSPSGRWVEYGLGVGSSDLIGFYSRTITSEMVGQSIAQFVAFECKAEGGVVSPEQQRFLDLVNAFGGLALATTSAREVKEKLPKQQSL